MPEGPPQAAIDRETLDALPVVPLLVYVDSQRNRYEFRSHAGTVALMKEMDPRDRRMIVGLAFDLLDCLHEDLREQADSATWLDTLIAIRDRT